MSVILEGELVKKPVSAKWGSDRVRWITLENTPTGPVLDWRESKVSPVLGYLPLQHDSTVNFHHANQHSKITTGKMALDVSCPAATNGAAGVCRADLDAWKRAIQEQIDKLQSAPKKPRLRTFAIEVPQGSKAGDPLKVRMPDGVTMVRVTVPEGAGPGTTLEFDFDLPDPNAPKEEAPKPVMPTASWAGGGLHVEVV